MSFAEALTIAKAMKKPIVYICNDYILGTDIDFSTLSIIIHSTDISRPIAVKLTEVYDEQKAEKLAVSDPIAFYQLVQFDDGYYINSIMEPELYAKIITLYRRLISRISGVPCIELDNLIENDQFASIIKMKNDDRHRWQYLNLEDTRDLTKYILSAFAQLHPVNASDKVNLKIYDVDEFSFIACFEIIKKKNIIVNEYIRYLYLQ